MTTALDGWCFPKYSFLFLLLYLDTASLPHLFLHKVKIYNWNETWYKLCLDALIIITIFLQRPCMGFIPENPSGKPLYLNQCYMFGLALCGWCIEEGVYMIGYGMILLARTMWWFIVLCRVTSVALVCLCQHYCC